MVYLGPLASMDLAAGWAWGSVPLSDSSWEASGQTLSPTKNGTDNSVFPSTLAKASSSRCWRGTQLLVRWLATFRESQRQDSSSCPVLIDHRELGQRQVVPFISSRDSVHGRLVAPHAIYGRDDSSGWAARIVSASGHVDVALGCSSTRANESDSFLCLKAV